MNNNLFSVMELQIPKDVAQLIEKAIDEPSADRPLSTSQSILSISSTNRQSLSSSRSKSRLSGVSYHLDKVSLYSFNPCYDGVLLLVIMIIIFIAGFVIGSFTVKYVLCDSWDDNKQAVINKTMKIPNLV